MQSREEASRDAANVFLEEAHQHVSSANWDVSLSQFVFAANNFESAKSILTDKDFVNYATSEWMAAQIMSQHFEATPGVQADIVSRMNKAIDCLRAIKNPDDAIYRNLINYQSALGDCYKNLGKNPEAIQCYEEAIKLFANIECVEVSKDGMLDLEMLRDKQKFAELYYKLGTLTTKRRAAENYSTCLAVLSEINVKQHNDDMRVLLVYANYEMAEYRKSLNEESHVGPALDKTDLIKKNKQLQRVSEFYGKAMTAFHEIQHLSRLKKNEQVNLQRIFSSCQSALSQEKQDLEDPNKKLDDSGKKSLNLDDSGKRARRLSNAATPPDSPGRRRSTLGGDGPSPLAMFALFNTPLASGENSHASSPRSSQASSPKPSPRNG